MTLTSGGVQRVYVHVYGMFEARVFGDGFGFDCPGWSVRSAMSTSLPAWGATLASLGPLSIEQPANIKVVIIRTKFRLVSIFNNFFSSYVKFNLRVFHAEVFLFVVKVP